MTSDTPETPSKKPVTIGWLIDAPKAGFIYSEPKPVKAFRTAPLSARAVQACPAVNEIERRCFEVTFPFDLRLRHAFEDGNHELYSVPEGTRVDEDLVPYHVFLMKPEHWREADKPVIQIRAPYVFVADERVYVNQFPPFMASTPAKWPGTMTAGRFPIDIWPRVLSWGFEWNDTASDLILKRGDPWFYVFFETENPDQRIRLVQAENTDALKEYRKGLADVVQHTSNTFSLFDTAKGRRPKTLLKERDL